MKKKAPAKPAPSRRESSGGGMNQAIVALLSLIGGIFFALAGAGIAGPVGRFLFGLLETLLGWGYWLLPLALLSFGFLLLTSWRSEVPPIKAVGGAVAIVSVLAIIGLAQEGAGGVVGGVLALAATAAFDIVGAAVVLVALLLTGIILLSGVEELRLPNLQAPELALPSFPKKKDEEEEEEAPKGKKGKKVVEEDEDEAPAAAPVPTPVKEAKEPVVKSFETKSGDDIGIGPIGSVSSEYDAPPLSLLGKDKGKPGVGDIKANANIIKRTLQNFGIDIELDEVSIGPTVTRYALKPAEGVRLSKIVSLQTNLELALAAHPVRIEAPIPGKSLVGIEVPNTSKAMVGLGGILGSDEFAKSDKPLLAALGRDITGASHVTNVAKMPHALVAGATGSGKSVAIHALITSLLFRNGPDTLRFIMVDPKRVELTLYNGIPHLLTPVITDAKKAILSLKWAAKEMDRRYNILEAEKVRDISSYHKETAGKEGAEPMPYIVVVIDELADIMQTYPRELEAGIVRLAQMSRAVGIHLILSTQRPSVNVITGLIKANVPTRCALQVASQIDSRTILDQAGAEKLLGAGDMLFVSGDMAKPVRIQTAYISEEEVKKVVSYIKQHNVGDLSGIDLSGNGDSLEPGGNSGGMAADIFSAIGDDDVDDDLYGEARAAVMEAGKASTSYLQRKLKIGYSRAARLMDILEEKGVIGSADGSKPREVIGASPRAGGSLEDEDAF